MRLFVARLALWPRNARISPYVHLFVLVYCGLFSFGFSQNTCRSRRPIYPL